MADPRPVRLRLSRAKGFSLQSLSLATNGLPAVNVARPSKHGTPFRIGRWFRIGERHSAGLTMAYSECLSSDPQHRRGYTLIETSAEAVDWFRRYRERYPLSRAVVDELRGKNLSCWCGLGAPCHADVLLEIANNRPICEAV